MARKTITQITDDLDGSQNAQEVSFSFDGVDYVIDLTKKNRGALEKALKPYIAAARKAPRRSSRRGTRTTATRDLAAVRSWAKQHGIAISDRGRVPVDVLAQYDAVH